LGQILVAPDASVARRKLLNEKAELEESMEITAVTATSAAGTLDPASLSAPLEQRPIRVEISAGARSDIGLILSNFGQAQGKSPAGGWTQTVDRLRADFEAMRHRLSSPEQASMTLSAHRAAAPAAQLQAAMNQAIKTQTEIFQVAVSFQAGLTASQQSQGAVKTLIEKS
jgi:hypothetical protein